MYSKVYLVKMEKRKLYDFYFSPSREKQLIKAYIIAGNTYHDTFINGKKYTEMVEHGKEPLMKPDDNKLIATDNGSDIKIIIRPEYHEPSL
jgi:hypothetical protein